VDTNERHIHLIAQKHAQNVAIVVAHLVAEKWEEVLMMIWIVILLAGVILANTHVVADVSSTKNLKISAV